MQTDRSTQNRRATLATLKEWWNTNKPKLAGKAQAMFHIRRSNWIIGGCWGIGFTVLLGAAFPPVPKELFYLAYVLFFISFVWSLGSFLTSESLRKRNPRNWPSKRRKKPEEFARALGKYHRRRFAGSLGLVLLLCFTWWATYAVKDARVLSEMGGLLIPAGDPDPPNACGTIPPNAIAIFYGTNVSLSTTGHTSVVTIRDYQRNTDEEILGIERNPDGTVGLNAHILSNDVPPKLIADISRNSFKINRNLIFDFPPVRPDRSTINMTDEYGNVFAIRYMNKHSIRVKGKFIFGPNRAVDVTDAATGPPPVVVASSCSRDAGSVFYLR